MHHAAALLTVAGFVNTHGERTVANALLEEFKTTLAKGAGMPRRTSKAVVQGWRVGVADRLGNSRE